MAYLNGVVPQGRAHAPQRLHIKMLLVSVLSLMLGHPLQAQFAEPRPTVTRALDFITAYSSPVDIGTNVVFTQRANLSDRGRALIKSGIQVRVFSLGEDEDRPNPNDIVGDCDVYISTVYRLYPTPSGGLQFAKMNPGWVNLSSSGRSTKDGRWFLVFEQVGASQEQFRIKTSDAPAYFETGFTLTVRDNRSIPMDVIREAYEARDKSLAKLYSTDSHVPCYSYRSLRASFEAGAIVAYGEIESCTKAGKSCNAQQNFSPLQSLFPERVAEITPVTGAALTSAALP